MYDLGESLIGKQKIVRYTENYIIIDEFLDENYFVKIGELIKEIEDKDQFVGSKDNWDKGLYSDWIDEIENDNEVKVSEITYNKIGNYSSKHDWKKGISIKKTDGLIPESIQYFQEKLMHSLYAFYFDTMISSKDGNSFDFNNIVSDMSSFFHLFPPGSNIFWHSDIGYQFGCTFYANDDWGSEWGGELLLEDNFWSEPKPNRLVIVKSPYWHKTTMTRQDIETNRATIQTFVTFKDKGVEY
tara:strand:- start:178 stop:903 length:726 start_codon:yes stop_codon:yes gene_type:complete